MATAIKAIPTLQGNDAVRFREEMEENEKKITTKVERSDRETDPFIVKMRHLLKHCSL